MFGNEGSFKDNWRVTPGRDKGGQRCVVSVVVSCFAAGGPRRLVARRDGGREEDHDALQGVQRGSQERAGETIYTWDQMIQIISMNF